MTADVEPAVVDVAAAPPWTIPEQLVRDLAFKVNPYVKVGGEPPVANLRPAGWLVDVVEKHGWDEALGRYPEARAFLRRLRNTLEELAAGAEGA